MNKNHIAAFWENEKEANKYTAKCMRVMAIVVAMVWLLNFLGIFIVPKTIMAIAAASSILLLLVPTALCRMLKDGWLKICNMGCCITAITCLTAAMPKHGIVVWAAPIALSCHYYSKKFTYGTLAASLLCMAAGMFVGAHYGEWDIALFIDKAMEPDRIFTAAIYRRLFVFMFFPRALTLVGICAVCVTLAGRTHALLEKQVKDSTEKQRIASELDVATHIQTSMLPNIFPAFPQRREFDIFASMTPAREVGGDFYDFFMVDEKHLAIVMADVSDKGVPAALFMVIGKTLIKDHTTPDADLGQVFTKVNDLLCESNSEGLFITAFEGVLNLETGELRYVNAGHEPPFLYRAGGDFAMKRVQRGFVLAGLEHMKYTAGSILLAEGDKIFQYTDGVTEATNAQQELFGMDRLAQSLNRAKHRNAKEIIQAVQEDIGSFVGPAPQFDDITMLCLEFKKRQGKTVAVTLDALPELLAFVEGLLEAGGAPLPVITKMDIALDEIFSNIVKFSGASSASVTCGIENGHTACLTIIDNGTPYNPLEQADPDITLSAEERDIGGLGIFMVKKSMSTVLYEYADGKNNLTMKLDF